MAEAGRGGHLAVVGAGTMGAQIAHQAALHGWTVTLCGRDLDRLNASADAAMGVLRKRVEKGKLDAADLDAAEKRLARSCDSRAFAEADVIIESVAEDREVKRRVLADIGASARPDAIIGSNSSTLPSSLFADVVPQPDRLLNIHFFNPALMMPLVEVVRGPQTSGATMQASLDFARSIGKTPVRVEKETYGFIANRILFIAMREAFTLVENGYVSMEACDDAVRGALGWPMGPFELADLVGLDVTEAILREGAAQTGETRWAPPHSLAERVTRGDLGRKTGRGFYPS